MRTVLIIICYIFLLGFYACSHEEQSTSSVVVKDIDHFWEAYDSVNVIPDRARRTQILQELYVERGTDGLHAFMDARGYSTEMWVDLIDKYPAFWKSIRNNTLQAKDYKAEIEEHIQTFKELYPGLKDARIYFAIGGLNTGGTIKDSLSLIGTEVASADETVDASELSTWHQNTFKSQSLDNIVEINIHEYVHTQQVGSPVNLLSKAIKEGSADFITELVLGNQREQEYLIYGKANEDSLKENFKQDMYSNDYSSWLYNGQYSKVADLGYFMGYAISKAYYSNQTEKSDAIRAIIELNYSDENAVDDFLKQSDYYTEPLDKKALLAAYEKKRPKVVSIHPVIHNRHDVDPNLQTLQIEFSKPMMGGYSINYGELGKEHYPITGVKGFSKK